MAHFAPDTRRIQPKPLDMPQVSVLYAFGCSLYKYFMYVFKLNHSGQPAW